MKIFSDNSFAAACYNQNSITELCEALNQTFADSTDCYTWKITPAEWRRSIRLALKARLDEIAERGYAVV